MNSENEDFIAELKKLALPYIIQSLIANSFSIINTLMVGGLGDRAVAATAAAGQVWFVLGMVMMAVYGISSFITQFYSKGDARYAGKAQALMFLSGVSVTMMAAIVITVFRIPLMRLFVNDEQAVGIGADYIPIIAVVFVVNSVKDSFVTGMDAIGKIKPGLYAGFVGMVVNTVLNYVLIYGKLGFKAYGVQGTAISSLVSASISAILIITFVYAREQGISLRIVDFRGLSAEFVKKVYTTTLPLIFHEGLWSLGSMLYAVAFGHMGISALTAYQLSRTVNSYFMLGVYGFAFAGRIMIAKRLGGDDKDSAVRCARKLTCLCTASAFVFSVLLLLMNPLIVKAFGNLSTDTRYILKHVLYIQAAFLIVNFLNNIWIVGTFGAGGDNLFTLKLILASTWFIAIPLVFAGAYVFKWPVEVIYLMFTMEEISKACMGYFRYRSDKWAKNLTVIVHNEVI